ncbi:MAG: biopolymer transporter ExbD [Phycisphaeraceae bacterium]|nr:biopolymer transporter ExbD [Phycisphaeraceae bacterium]MCW5754703.1 biopolymer transporter ExbD [Phycisphaeraceae bacterium]
MASRLRRRGLHADMHFGPSMTPMVDVVLVILIFFMGAAVLLGPERLLAIVLPEQAQPEAGDPFAVGPAHLTIRLSTSTDGVRIHGAGLREAPPQALLAHARDLADRLGSENVSIIIEADDDVAYQDVVAACDAYAEAGIARVGVR